MVKHFFIMKQISFKRLNYIVLILFLIFVSCNNQASKPTKTDVATDIEAEKEAVKKTLNQMWLAIENEDIDAYASYVHPDFSQFGEYDSILKTGKKIEVKSVHNWIKESSNIHTEMIDPIVTIKEGVAWITYYWYDHGITNGEAFTSRGKSTRIFVKENGKWLCIHGHYTLLPAPN